MKQHITLEQLKEINILNINKVTKSEEIKSIIKNIKYFEKSERENYPYKYNNVCQYLWDRLAGKITIGKMIEILYKYDCDIQIISAGKQWYIEVAAHIRRDSEELADALWEAVKYVLEVENEIKR